MKLLKDEEWRVLIALERASIKMGGADASAISRISRLKADRIEFALKRLNERDLVRRSGINYLLTFTAIEALALREYVRRDLISALGAIIAKGKESDVYEAFNEVGKLYAIKFFKLGRTSFTRVRAKRFVDKSEVKNWITINYEAARREYRSLARLGMIDRFFPKAIAYNRNTILLEEINGIRLSERPHLTDAEKTLKEIILAMRKAYIGAGIINADMSEYNVLTDGKRIWLIDWPQSVTVRHPNALYYLRRDLGSILRFFRRVYGVSMDEEEAMDYIIGRREYIGLADKFKQSK